MSDRTFVTGFKAFLKVGQNPSETLAEASARRHQTLEVSYRAVDDFLASLEASTFDRLLMIGVAAGRDHMSLELFARNIIGKTPDVRGYAPFGQIDKEAPLLLSATLWTPDRSARVLMEVPHARASMDAGSYLCNYISFRALQRFPDKHVGFLHIPMPDKIALDDQQMALSRILEILEAPDQADDQSQ